MPRPTGAPPKPIKPAMQVDNGSVSKVAQAALNYLRSLKDPTENAKHQGTVTVFTNEAVDLTQADIDHVSKAFSAAERAIMKEFKDPAKSIAKGNGFAISNIRVYTGGIYHGKISGNRAEGPVTIWFDLTRLPTNLSQIAKEAARLANSMTVTRNTERIVTEWVVDDAKNWVKKAQESGKAGSNSGGNSINRADSIDDSELSEAAYEAEQKALDVFEADGVNADVSVEWERVGKSADFSWTCKWDAWEDPTV